MTIKTDFNFGDLVYLKTDDEQKERMVTAINVTPDQVQYQLSFGSQTSWHYVFEISIEKRCIKNDIINHNWGNIMTEREQLTLLRSNVDDCLMQCKTVEEALEDLKEIIDSYKS